MTHHRSHFPVAGLGLLLGLIGPGFGGGVATAQASRSKEDLTCGPRCLQFILSRHGQETDLIDLIRATQWPDLESGASLDRMQACLESRGIHTTVIRFRPGRRFHWPYPILLHTEEGDPPRGHYVVRIPGASRDHDDLIWAGQEGWRRGSWEDVTRGFSGLALITSPTPITDPDAALEPLPISDLLRIVGFATCGGLVTLGVLWLVRSRRR